MGKLVAGHVDVKLTCRFVCEVSNFNNAFELGCVEYTTIVTQTSRAWRHASASTFESTYHVADLSDTQTMMFTIWGNGRSRHNDSDLYN